MQRRFTATHPDVFAMTLLAESLRSDHPRSPRAAYLLLAPDIQAWALPDYCLRTEEPAFDQAYGKGAWEFFAEHPSGDARFDVSRQAVIRQEVRALIPAYDQGSSGTIVDVRGHLESVPAGAVACPPKRIMYSKADLELMRVISTKSPPITEARPV
jgi:hypothetical protein